MAINTQKVVVGGVAAGVVAVALDYLVNGVLLAEQNEAAMAALSPEIAANLEGGGFVAVMISMNLFFGLVMAFTYAAIRPRFGAGAKTAVVAAALIWCAFVPVNVFFVASGMFEAGFMAMGVVIFFVQLVVVASVAGYLYSEDEAPAPVTASTAEA